MTELSINGERLVTRIRELGQVGRDKVGKLSRLTGSDADKLGRDKLVEWLKAVGLEVVVDKIGNVFGFWRSGLGGNNSPVIIGSHVDTVIDAGMLDGAYGVLAGLEVIETLKAAGDQPARPIVVAAFTNEEGVRFAPGMLGSLVFAGGRSLEEALALIGTDGATLGAELKRIGYAGTLLPGAFRPHAYVEIHIEQGPVLEHEGNQIGAVENLQGISWQRVTVRGAANHAGTTPMSMRRDAGVAAARLIAIVRDHVRNSKAPTVATVGTMRFEPNAVNIIPATAVFTIDLRDPNDERLRATEESLRRLMDEVATEENVTISVERMSRFEPVIFDNKIVELIEQSAAKRGLRYRRMTSGAGHDAQMMARIAPTAMIFVPSRGGISHSPHEFTPDADLIAGTNVLLDVVTRLAES